MCCENSRALRSIVATCSKELECFSEQVVRSPHSPLLLAPAARTKTQTTLPDCGRGSSPRRIIRFLHLKRSSNTAVDYFYGAGRRDFTTAPDAGSQERHS